MSEKVREDARMVYEETMLKMQECQVKNKT